MGHYIADCNKTRTKAHVYKVLQATGFQDAFASRYTQGMMILKRHSHLLRARSVWHVPMETRTFFWQSSAHLATALTAIGHQNR